MTSYDYHCDEEGKCPNCKDNITGDTCDRCKTGYVDFPDCNPRNYISPSDRSDYLIYPLEGNYVSKQKVPMLEHIDNRLDNAALAHSLISDSNCTFLYDNLFNPVDANENKILPKMIKNPGMYVC